MFIFVAAEQLRQLVDRQNGFPQTVTPSTISAPAKVSPVDSVAVDAPTGTRYQLLRALRAMASGEFMVVAHRIPDAPETLDNPGKREAWFRSLRNPANWRGHVDVDPVLVPGTAYPLVIGRIMLRCGWCAPSDQPHWIPDLRFYFLNDMGRESFRKAQAWWSQLTLLERVQAMVLE